MTRISFVDQGPVSAEHGPGETLRQTVELAKLADEIGYCRYWLAEHHGVRNMGVTAPEILIGHIADRTSRLRVGSGGMMLPNHAPLHVAEQFRTLEALHPGRIDLGIGRSTGTGDEPTKNALLRTADGMEKFGQHLSQLMAITGGPPLDAGDPYAKLIANPADVTLPEVFLLGSSMGSAETAARAGLGYAFFTVYQDPESVVTALRHYRKHFVPATPGAEPHAIVAARAWVGEDDEHADALASSERLAVLDYLTGNPSPLEPVDRAQSRKLTTAQLDVRAKLDFRSDIIGGVESVRSRLRELTEATGADEVMALSNIEDPRERRDSLRRLATAAGAGDGSAG